jgi:enoyl-CoA hydratase/carnithine racemase
MLLFGEPISAQEAYKYGLINKVVANGGLQDAIEEYIGKANGLSGEVVALGKRVLSKQSPLDIEKAYCLATEGMRENILEKDDCK